MRILTPFLVACWSLLSMAQGADDAWLDTYESGLKKAAEDKKDVLISFMGSDWCDQCKVLQEAVFSKDEFFQNVSKNYVLVELDFPQTKPKIAERNEPIRVQYGVRGYPVLVLADSSGAPYGEVRYHREWAIKDYLTAIAEQMVNKETRDEARAEFEQAEDDETRTTALEKLFQAVPETSISKMYPEEFAALRKSSQDKSPLVSGIVKKERLENMQQGLQVLMGQRRYKEAVALCDEFLANENMDTHEKQAGYTFKYYSLMELRDFAGAMKAAEALREVDGNSPIGKQAIGLVYRAKAALAKADPPKLVHPIAPIPEGKQVGEKKGDPKVAQTQGVAPTQKSAPKPKPAEKKVETSAVHQKSLVALEEAHVALIAAEKALAKAEGDLATARERHAEAHRIESATRQVEEPQAADEAKPKEEQSEESTSSAAKVEAFEKRAAELRKQAEELRKSAEKLRKEASE